MNPKDKKQHTVKKKKKSNKYSSYLYSVSAASNRCDQEMILYNPKQKNHKTVAS